MLLFAPAENGGLGVALGTSAAGAFGAENPLAVEIVTREGAAQWLWGTYTAAAKQKGGVLCKGEITSLSGTRFVFNDFYKPLPEPGAFEMTRTVLVAVCGKNDAGFSTRFSLRSNTPLTTKECEFFVPGIWYKNNAHVPPRALAADTSEPAFVFREDRLPLPVSALRIKDTGATLVLQHVGGNPATFALERGLQRIIDARMLFGSLGFLNGGNLETIFQMPGSEGPRTYCGTAKPGEDPWAKRSHPVLLGFTHCYTLRFWLGTSKSCADMVQKTWCGAMASAKPPTIRADLNRVYYASQNLLGTYCRKYNGVISVPFQAKIPSGEVKDTSSQMGFVGQALPSAALLLHYGLQTKNDTFIRNATEAIDFWIKNGISAANVPRNWYDIRADGTVSWRPYQTFLRIASDGASGVLRAWETLRRAGSPRPEWLHWCKRYGDFLVKAQNGDGSYFRAYDLAGIPQDKSLDTTDHPIAFLCDLASATGDMRYKNAAVRAGNFCYSSVHDAYAYVGGTPDNPNVCDKEAGMMALSAFLALHDATGDTRWKTAATQAAWFCKTWVYQQNLPMPPGASGLAFPVSRTTHGMSLIAAGHSGADNYMAAAPFFYYRLYLLSGDSYFRDAAHRLMHNTKQLLNWDNTLGYYYPGLLIEAVNLASSRGKGVMGWLPWLSVAVLEPMVRLHDAFGTFDIDQIEKMPKSEVVRRSREWGRTRGFGTASPARS